MNICNCMVQYMCVVLLLLRVASTLLILNTTMLTTYYRCFQRELHLIECARYAYVVPTLCLLVGGKTCSDMMKSSY